MRAGVVAKPSPLGDERGSVREIGLCPTDGGNLAFQPAIPKGMLIIDLLLQVVLFGVFSGCLRVVSRGGFQTPSGDISKGCPRAF